jgi:hypothetical protein
VTYTYTPYGDVLAATGPGDAVGANVYRYAYAASDPINNTDPTGMSCVTDAIGAAVAAAGFTGGIAAIGVFAPTGAPLVLAVSGTTYAYGELIDEAGGAATSCA